MNMIFLHLPSSNYGRERTAIIRIEVSSRIYVQFLLAKRSSSQTTNVLTLSETTGHFKTILCSLITLNDFFQLWIV